MPKQSDNREKDNSELSSQRSYVENHRGLSKLAGQAFMREYSDTQIEAVNEALEKQNLEKRYGSKARRELA